MLLQVRKVTSKTRIDKQKCKKNIVSLHDSCLKNAKSMVVVLNILYFTDVETIFLVFVRWSEEKKLLL